MSAESTTPDLVEMTRKAFEAASRHDLESVMGFFAPDAVLDTSEGGIGAFEGLPAIRGFVEDWWGTWRDHVIEAEEMVGLGHGVLFATVQEAGRLAGNGGQVEQRRGWVFLWVQGMIERLTINLDIDEARAAAKQLAESRG